MTVFNAFAPSTLGMKSQTQGLGTISMNIANATTGGYKRTETRFQTVLSESLDQLSDLGGVRPLEVQMIDRQGIVLTTARDLDLAIVGDGFFVVSTALTGGQTYYTRDGAFEMRLETPGTGTGVATTAPGYLVDKNGHYLKGWAPDANGVFPTTGTPQALRVDADFFRNLFERTTLVDLGVNLPASAPLIANHAAAVATADAGPPPAGFHSYSISVIDSAGNLQPVRLNFTRSALNTWQVSATHSRTPVAQVDTVTLGGTIFAGDIYNVTVAGTTFTHTVGAGSNIGVVRAALIAQINAAPNLPITAAAGAAAGAITLTADVAGNSFTASATVTPASVANNTASIVNTVANAPLVAQVDTATLAGTIEAGDLYSATINGTTFSYTLTGAEPGINTVRDALIALINANAALPVTASTGGLGQIVLTADVPGTGFTATVAAVNVGGTAAAATTTANGTNTTTTAATTVPFTRIGASGTMSGATVVPPNPIALALTFNGGSTASFNLDLATTTQFDTGFLALNQSINGFEKSELRGLSWDQDGFLVGSFNSNNSRRLYKVPLANFVSPNSLNMKNGMVFEESSGSGPAKIEDAAVSGRASFSPGAIESSNVDIAQEFTRMIQTQAIYNANALAFRTNDEMAVTARDLARA